MLLFLLLKKLDRPMLSGDDLIDEFQAMALARTCLDYDPNVKKEIVSAL